MEAKTFHIITLGCKVNQYESEAVREAWLNAGHKELQEANNADIVLINSCAITAKAVSDLRAVARKVKRLSPNCELLVTGCAAQALPKELSELPIDTLIPQQEKVSLLRWLEGCEDADLSNFPEHNHAHDDHEDENDFWGGAGPDEDLYEEATIFPPFAISGYARSRAVLKIHDGCSQHCTYCIVPQGRGPSVSRPWPESIAEAGRLINAGFREIVLNGVNLRQYGLDLPQKEDFWDLVKRLESTFGPEWAAKGQDEVQRLRFRISSLEPGQLDDKALEVLAASKLIAPQLHLSLQSGSPTTLKHMGRGHYDPSTIVAFLEKLRAIWPEFGLGADVITGFPGESEEHFEETMQLAAELPLSYAHVFPYSIRPGTAAAKLPKQLAPEVKKERAARLRALVDEKREAFLQHQLSMSQMLVAEDEGKGQGVNEFYTDCRFVEKPIHEGKELIKSVPVGIEKGKLLVRAI